MFKGVIYFIILFFGVRIALSEIINKEVLAVLNDLTKVLIRHLSEGKIVKLGDFGNFQITLTSEGAPTAEKFTASLIKGNKIQFRPGADLREMLKTVKYEKYKK